MKIVYGFDIDGTLLPLKGKTDNLQEVRDMLKRVVEAGNIVEIVTCRKDVEEGVRLLAEHGILQPVNGFSRAEPAEKARYLLSVARAHGRATRTVLVDDEKWFLDPAVALGLMTLIVKDGSVHQYRPEIRL